MEISKNKLSTEDFPSEIVEEKAFNECFFRFKEELHSASDEMKKNELALRISVDYYKEGYTKRAIDLAEYMYFRTTQNYQNAIIQEKKVAPVQQKKDRPSNPFSKYRI